MRTEAKGDMIVYRGTLVAHTDNTDLVKHQTKSRLETEQIYALSSTWSKFRVLSTFKSPSGFVRNGIAGTRQSGLGGKTGSVSEKS